MGTHSNIAAISNPLDFNDIFDEIKRYSSSNNPIGVIHIDIDNFRGYYDIFGPEQRECALYEVYKAIKISSDMGIRIGADKFLALTEEERERTTAESICERVGNLEIPVVGNNTPTNHNGLRYDPSRVIVRAVAARYEPMSAVNEENVRRLLDRLEEESEAIKECGAHLRVVRLII